MRSTLREEQVKALFSSSSKECDVLIGLLKLAIPNWDKVEYILEGMAYNLRPLLRFQRKSSRREHVPRRPLAEHGVFYGQEPWTLGGRHLRDEVHLEERLASCEIGNIWINNLN